MHQLYLDIISGRRKSLGASAARGFLSACAPVYGIGIELRNARYRRASAVHRAAAPVISVGNLTTGGTGKTPTVAWIVHQLIQLGRRPGIVSRGYRAGDDGGNDEKRLLDRLCPGTPHVQHPDRVAAAATAIHEHGCDVIVLDDGFQHRRLHRDLDLVLIDALCPWGYGHLLPRGLLREPRRALGRAALILLTRCDLAGPAAAGALCAAAARWANCPVLETSFRPTSLVNGTGERQSLDVLRGARAAAFCGIGNPDGFFRTLSAAGCTLDTSGLRVFPDHYHYGPNDLRGLGDWARQRGAEMLLTTQKDATKIPASSLGGVPLWSVSIELAFADGQASWINAQLGQATVARRAA